MPRVSQNIARRRPLRAAHLDSYCGSRRDRRCGSGCRSARAREQGSSSLQLVVLLPVMFSVMFLGVQAALYYHAREVAIAAAHEGAREAGGQTGTREAGVNAAADFIAQAGGADVLPGSQVRGSRSATTATITVTGHSLSVIPGWKPAVEQSSSVPVERLTR